MCYTRITIETRGHVFLMGLNRPEKRNAFDLEMYEEIGWGNAMRYLLTGEEISGPEAYRLGLVQELTEPGNELDRAIEIATDISKRAPLGVMAALKSARIARVEGPNAAFARLMPDLMPIIGSEDAIEGVMSFIERREANFKGK